MYCSYSNLKYNTIVSWLSSKYAESVGTWKHNDMNYVLSRGDKKLLPFLTKWARYSTIETKRHERYRNFQRKAVEHDRNSNVKPGCANQVNRSSPCFLQVLFETHAYLLDRDDNKCQRLYITIAPHYTDGASFYRRNLRFSGIPAWYSRKIMFLEMLVATFPDINHRPLHICPHNTAKNFLTLIIPTLLTFVQSQISRYASTNIECKSTWNLLQIRKAMISSTRSSWLLRFCSLKLSTQ